MHRSQLEKANERRSQSAADIELIHGGDRIRETWPAQSADYLVATLVMCSVEDLSFFVSGQAFGTLKCEAAGRIASGNIPAR